MNRIGMEERYEVLCELVDRLADMDPWQVHGVGLPWCFFCGAVESHKPDCLWDHARTVR